MSDLARESSGASGPPGAPDARLLFCADLHGKLGQFEQVLTHAIGGGFGWVVFGGDLTPKTPERRTATLQRALLADELFPLFRKMVDPSVLRGALILGNDDIRSNRAFVAVMDGLRFQSRAQGRRLAPAAGVHRSAATVPVPARACP
ncbi:MAG: hypothetical protein GVY11_02320 [Gammaproteobacteria bacterium]|jgi:hypothetical protein|nr:hypothetical protein [Gammaproteobacteria bacterium]